MLRKLECGKLLNVQNVVRSCLFNYRMEPLNIPPSEERFVVKMADLCNNFPDKSVPKLMERVEVVKKFGFKTFQVIEYPLVLKMDVDDIESRLKLLKDICKDEIIVLSMLKYAKHPLTKTVLKSINKCREKSTFDGVSGSEYFRRTIKCTDEQMVDILSRNPRLRPIGTSRSFADKVNVLLEYGAQLQDIWMNTGVLNNKPLQVIKSRVEELRSLGHDDPLPIGHVGREEEEYQKIISMIKGPYFESNEKTKECMDAMRKASVKPTMIYIQKPKFDYLVEQGYTFEEIIKQPNVLSHSLELIKKSLDTLKSHYMGKIPLSRCLRLTNGRITAPKFNRLPFKNINGFTKEMTPSIWEKLKKYTTGAPENISIYFKNNLDFLLEQGFAKEDLFQLPIVLCHEEEVLKSKWEALKTEDNFEEKVSLNKLVILNKLQYLIERSNNFQPYCTINENSNSVEEEKESDQYEMEDTFKGECSSDYEEDYDEPYAAVYSR